MNILTKIAERLERNDKAFFWFMFGCFMFMVSILLYMRSLYQEDGYYFVIGILLIGVFLPFMLSPIDEECYADEEDKEVTYKKMKINRMEKY